MSEKAYDRADAVNLATNIVMSPDVFNITQFGLRKLAAAVLAMDEQLKRTAAQQPAESAMTGTPPHGVESTACVAAPRLDTHAQVGSAVFGPGISWETVIDCAKRHYVYQEEDRTKNRTMTREDRIKEEMNRRQFFDMFFGIDFAAAQHVSDDVMCAAGTEPCPRLDRRQRSEKG